MRIPTDPVKDPIKKLTACRILFRGLARSEEMPEHLVPRVRIRQTADGSSQGGNQPGANSKNQYAPLLRSNVISGSPLLRG